MGGGVSVPPGLRSRLQQMQQTGRTMPDPGMRVQPAVPTGGIGGFPRPPEQQVQMTPMGPMTMQQIASLPLEMRQQMTAMQNQADMQRDLKAGLFSGAPDQNAQMTAQAQFDRERQMNQMNAFNASQMNEYNRPAPTGQATMVQPQVGQLDFGVDPQMTAQLQREQVLLAQRPQDPTTAALAEVGRGQFQQSPMQAGIGSLLQQRQAVMASAQNPYAQAQAPMSGVMQRMAAPQPAAQRAPVSAKAGRGGPSPLQNVSAARMFR